MATAAQTACLLGLTGAGIRQLGRTQWRTVTIRRMRLSDIFLGLGRENFDKLLRLVSIGRLKTYRLYERVKLRFRMNKLNGEALRKAAPKLWARVEERDEDFAADLAQAMLVSHLEMIQKVLDHLEIPHDEGFFAKDADIKSLLKDGWEESAWEAFRETYPPAALLFYINHLGWEVEALDEVFAPEQVA